jgi:hypothetical protein
MSGMASSDEVWMSRSLSGSRQKDDGKKMIPSISFCTIFLPLIIMPMNSYGCLAGERDFQLLNYFSSLLAWI